VAAPLASQPVCPVFTSMVNDARSGGVEWISTSVHRTAFTQQTHNILREPHARVWRRAGPDSSGARPSAPRMASRRPPCFTIVACPREAPTSSQRISTTEQHSASPAGARAIEFHPWPGGPGAGALFGAYPVGQFGDGHGAHLAQLRHWRIVAHAFHQTPVFTKAIERLIDDDDYRGLQIALMLRPEQGPVIRGGGGIRKVRWARPGGGKRGGLRIIYYWAPSERAFYMLYV
jgi:hypothetical protein